MLRPQSSAGSRWRRPGKTLVLFVLLAPVLLGMIGLVIDTGLLLNAQRQAQHAADAAALAAARARLAGQSEIAATAAAQAYLQQQSGLANATLVLNMPPNQGSYAGNCYYAEAIVTSPLSTWFIQVLGAAREQTVSARSVAGLEAVPGRETLLALDPAAAPGLAVSGGTVVVQGRVAVNAQGAGYDQNNSWVDLGYAASAVTTGNGGVLQAVAVRVVGGVDSPTNIQPLSGRNTTPLLAGSLLRSDPLLYLHSPMLGNGVSNQYPGPNGQRFTSPQSVSVSVSGGSSVTLDPGIYTSIAVTGAGPGTVTFNPGLYVLLGGQPIALLISTGAAVVGNGVLFYNTGSDYDVTTGLPDSGDGNTSGNDPNSNNTFGSISLAQAGSWNLTPLTDQGSPFDGLLLYQRRWNSQPITIQGGSTQDQIAGTLYARWARVNLVGPGTYQGQVIAGGISLSGPAQGNALTLNYGPRLGRARQVYLVE